jgi:hypothetical protein
MTARDHIRVSPPAAPSSRPAPGLSAVFAGRRRWIPAFAGMTVEGVWRRRVGVVSDIGAAFRGNGRRCRPARCGSMLPSSRPVPGLSAVFARRRRWIPAFAGMTVEGVWRRRVGVVSDMGDGVCGDGRGRGLRGWSRPSAGPPWPAPPSTVAAPPDHRRCPAPTSTLPAPPDHRRRCPAPAPTVSAQKKHRHPREGGDPPWPPGGERRPSGCRPGGRWSGWSAGRVGVVPAVRLVDITLSQDLVSRQGR